MSTLDRNKIVVIQNRRFERSLNRRYKRARIEVEKSERQVGAHYEVALVYSQGLRVRYADLQDRYRQSFNE